jgi:glycosyltransferase involved in cell wall biosynthesis
MKILHVVEPLATGINTFILQLTENITEAEHTILHGIRKDVQSIDSIKKEYNPSVQFIHWENAQREIRPFRDINAFHELKRIIEKVNPDIIHLHSSKAGILGRIAAKRLGYKNVIYTPNAAAFLRTDVGKIKISVYKIIEKLSSRLPGNIISSSNCELSAFEKLKIESKLIFNGAKVIKGDDTPPKNKKFTIVNCGMISIQKNPDLFNDIALEFKDDPEISFLWIGDGVIREKLNSPNIEITGWKSKAEVFDILFRSQLYLSTSLWEGLPLAGIEAMGSGLPLLLNSCPGNDNLINSDKNGLLFQDKLAAMDFIKKVKLDADYQYQLSQESIKNYNSNFTDAICSNNYRELYLSLMH